MRLNMEKNQSKDVGGVETPYTVRVWDIPVRVFHWTLVALVAVSLITGEIGGVTEMDIHMMSGYAILTLVLFRIVWGFVGSQHARFSDFVHGVPTAMDYVKSFIGGKPVPAIGHNPMGGWAVVALLILLLVQAVTGLFSSDDILTEGPLAAMVGSSMSGLLTEVHEAVSVALRALVIIHILAVGAHMIKGESLIVPMFTGRKKIDGDSPVPDTGFVSPWRALAIVAVAAGCVALVVNA
jgi:cytochrome b